MTNLTRRSGRGGSSNKNRNNVVAAAAKDRSLTAATSINSSNAVSRGGKKRRRAASDSSRRSASCDDGSTLNNDDEGTQGKARSPTESSKRSKPHGTVHDSGSTQPITCRTRNGPNTSPVVASAPVETPLAETGISEETLVAPFEDPDESFDAIIVAYGESHGGVDSTSSGSLPLPKESASEVAVRQPHSEGGMATLLSVPDDFVDSKMAERGYYAGLIPHPPPFRPIKSFYFREEEQIAWMTYPNVACKVSEEAAAHVWNALMFTRYRWLFNLARSNIEDTVIVDNKLRDVESGNLAVCVTIGVVNSCQVVHGSASLSATSTHQVHQITIRPFGFDFYRQQTYLGIKFGYDEICGPLFLNGLRVRTLAEGESPAVFASTNPSLATSRYDGVKVGACKCLPVFTGPVPYQVPIDLYDGCYNGDSPFMFSGDEFERIRSWPLLRDIDGKLTDLTHDSIIAIAYTVRKTGSKVSTLFPELQFGIALHVNDS